MSSHRYIFDPINLRYNRSSLGFRHTIIRKLPYIFLSVLLGAASYIIMSKLHKTRDERMLQIRNAELEKNYHHLLAGLEKLNHTLSELEHTDDAVYRALLGFQPLDSSVRIAGKGGNEVLRPGVFHYSETINATAREIDRLSSRLSIEEQSLLNLLKAARKNKKRMMHLPAVMPIRNEHLQYTGSGFGMRYHPILNIRRMHEGIDFIAPEGTPVFATANGTICSARFSNTFGNTIEIDHGYGYKTLYAHLKSFTVKTGQVVQRGDQIGCIGNTGLSAGYHLHYEVHRLGREVDPINYFFNDLTSEEYEKIRRLAEQNDTSLD